MVSTDTFPCGTGKWAGLDSWLGSGSSGETPTVVGTEEWRRGNMNLMLAAGVDWGAQNDLDQRPCPLS